MKLFAMAGILSCLFARCKNFNIAGNEELAMKQIKVQMIVADTILNGKALNDTISLRVTYLDNIQIYQFEEHDIYSDTSPPDPNKNSDHIRSSYFIFDPLKDSGFFLNSLKEPFHKKIKGDSILISRAFNGGKGFPMQGKAFEAPADPIIVENNGRVKVYKYVFNKEFYDSAYFTYDRSLLDIDFSFIPQLDAAFKSRLCKIELFIHHDSKYDINPLLNHFFVNSYEIKKENVSNGKEMLELYSRFQSVREPSNN